MDGFWAEMAKLGKDRNPYRAGFLQFVGVGESRQHAMDLYGEAAEYFYGNCLHIDPRFATPPGYATEATQRVGLASQVTKAASYSDKFNKLAREMDAIVENGYVIIGSPDEVAEQLREVAVNLNRRQPDAAAAVRQHEQGADQVQFPPVCRAGDTEG